MVKKPDTIKLYLPEGERQRVKQLLERLDKQGVDLKDQRGVLSTSKLFRYLVEKEINNQPK